MPTLAYHDENALLKIEPDGELVCICPNCGKRSVPPWRVECLKKLLGLRTECRTGDILFPSPVGDSVVE
jgi:hypothetical protein